MRLSDLSDERTEGYRLRHLTSRDQRPRDFLSNAVNTSPFVRPSASFTTVQLGSLANPTTMARRRTLGPPPLYDEVSVEMRHTKRGSRLVTKKTPVTLHSPALSSSTSATSSQQAAQQIAKVPEPSDLPDYNEIAFDDLDIRPPRKGKVSSML